MTNRTTPTSSADTREASVRDPIDHDFKSHPDVFWPAARGEKMFEFRRDDRPGGYHVGQTIRLRCYDTGTQKYSPVPPLDRRITNILRGGEFGLQDGFCILSLAALASHPTPEALCADQTARPVGDALREALKVRVHGRTALKVADLVEARVSKGEQPGANFPSEWLPFLVRTLRAALAQTQEATGQGAGVYLASKTAHAARWRDLRASGLPIISTWIDEAGKGETACFADLWRRCVDEAATARALIVYMEPGEVLKGAFVEVGAALACGVPVFAVGCDEFSFTNHIGVTRCGSLADAIRLATPASTPNSGEV